MTARELMELLIGRAAVHHESTCDLCIAGNPDREIHRAATCFKCTSAVIKEAVAHGVDLLIVHEPVFTSGDSREKATPVDLKKWELLDEVGITVWRFHDHAHESVPDYIHEGFLRATGLEIARAYEHESLGVARYELKNPMTVREIVKLIDARAGVKATRVVGATEGKIKTICLGLGSIAIYQLKILDSSDTEMFIAGEAGEVSVCDYVRELNEWGKPRTLLLLGHFGSEWLGMKLLAEELDETLIPTEYIDSGEVFTYLED